MGLKWENTGVGNVLLRNESWIDRKGATWRVATGIFPSLCELATVSHHLGWFVSQCWVITSLAYPGKNLIKYLSGGGVSADLWGYFSVWISPL